jgi:hypothetical protein
MKKSILKISSIFFLFVLLVSCDKDFNSLDSDVIGDDHFDLELYDEASVIAYSKATGPVQTNNLPLNALGIYNNPKFGVTKAHFVSQVELKTENPNFGFNPVIDSVYLYVPYFTTQTSTEPDGGRTYELDSVYGYSETAKFRLRVLENGFYIRDFNPTENLQTAQKYYSDDKSLVDPFKGTELLNNSSVASQNNEFFFNNKEIKIYKTNGQGLYVDSQGVVLANQTDVSLRVVKERRAPGMWLDLKNSFFQQKILNATTSGNLYSNNVFKNYFRGLLFEVEEISAGQGALALLDFANAELRILYKASSQEPTLENPNPTRTRRDFDLKMGFNGTTLRSNSINFFEYNNSPDYNVGITSGNETTGSENLYIKGGNGSVAFIDLFTPTQLQDLRQSVAAGNWMVNDAILIFYIDKVKMAGLPLSSEPDRIYIYDATNNRPIFDYSIDVSSSNNPKKNKIIFGGIIQKEGEGATTTSVKYTIRLTEHIKKILKADENGEYQDNIKIGLSVTESINIPTTASIKSTNSISIGGANPLTVNALPLGSVINPLGTILHGNIETSGNEDKKLKLNIYFTKPN